jgi:hypothetical protein
MIYTPCNIKRLRALFTIYSSQTNWICLFSDILVLFILRHTGFVYSQTYWFCLFSDILVLFILRHTGFVYSETYWFILVHTGFVECKCCGNMCIMCLILQLDFFFSLEHLCYLFLTYLTLHLDFVGIYCKLLIHDHKFLIIF